MSVTAHRDRKRANQTTDYTKVKIAMASGNDMKAHAGTYDSFIALLKWTVPILAVIGLLVILLISN